MVAIEDGYNIDGGDVKEHLKGYLAIIGSGSFATSRTLPDAANPGILVEGLGTIGLPLSERDASELCQRCHEARFGKGTETFVDRIVRKTEAGRVRLSACSNPQSNQYRLKLGLPDFEIERSRAESWQCARILGRCLR
jgi:hypothetical protein